MESNASPSMTTQAKDESFRNFTYEKELERARAMKEDLDKGGWREIHRSPGVCYWMKTFPEDEVPIKILFTFDLPMPAERFADLMHPSNQSYRNRWDKAFHDHETLEVYPDNGGHLVYGKISLFWPLSDREFLMFRPPGIEIDWSGQKSFFIIFKNAWHPSKPENVGGVVRATNGGNFFIVTPDEKNPEGACKVFSLTSNNYNGCLPKTGLEFMLRRSLPRVFNRYRQSMINGYNEFFAKSQEKN